jgi:hypothetical protein
MATTIGYCFECGYSHANLEKCWRVILRSAREKLADPGLDPSIREKLQKAVDDFEEVRRDTEAFFRACAEAMNASD